uniref:CSON008622 protein n=1 Tax=Culicoides sonorensis TaxID=179676 RepID=A0A336LZM4_CULSO
MIRTFTALTRQIRRSYCVTAKRASIIHTLKEQSPKINEADVTSLLDHAPELSHYNPELWRKSYDFLISQQNFSLDSYLKIIALYPKILTTSHEIIFKQLEAWRACQFGERRFQDLITKHPALIQHGNEKKLTRRMGFLQSFVTTPKNVWRIMMSSPEVAIEPEPIIEAKFKYLMEEMLLEVPEIVDSDVFSHTLEHIKMRHIFLDRLGMYKYRNPKKDIRHEKRTNPKLSQIVDTSDKRFACKICYVTLEEYEIFKVLIKREWQRKEIHDEDENFDDLRIDQGIDNI